MRAFEILNEGRSKPIAEDEALKLLDTDFSASKNSTPIFRGLRGKSDTPFMLADSSSYAPRKAANTQNYANLCVDNFNSWQAYPKRSKSFICTTASAYASGFGVVFRVYPINGANIGICSSGDFWGSFSNFRKNGLQNIHDFNGFINSIIGDMYDNNFQEFIKELNARGAEFLKNPKNVLPKNPFYRLLLNKYAKNADQPLSSLIEALLEPTSNGFSHQTIENFKEDKKVEVWTEGPVLLIDYDKNRMLT